MASFQIGSLVWAKLKGFQAWPGKIVEPKEDIKKPATKKNLHFVYFFGSENYAWIQRDNIFSYAEHKKKYESGSRMSKQFKEALEAIENEHQARLASGADEDLLSIDEEVALMQKSYEEGGDAQPEPKRRSGKKTKDEKPQSEKRASKTASPAPTTKKSATKRASTSTTPSSSKKFYMNKKDEGGDSASKVSEDSMRDSYHFTNMLSGDTPITKLETPDISVSDEKVASRTIIPTPLRIGFLGLGIMGQGMVMNLLRSGHEVTVWNRTATKCRDFVKAGALKGNNPADVVQSCDITFTCVADSTAVRDIMFGNMGVLDGISKGKCYVEMSTVDEETVQDVADAIMARGGAFLEAPVCGSRVPALEGQLLILASGDRKLYEDCYSCFQAIGKKSFYLGNEVGTATRMKLINNMVLGNMIASLAEGMSLAEKVGIELDEFAEILSLGSLSCTALNHKTQAILNDRFDPHFPLQHQQKDLRLVLGLGDSVEQPLFLAAAANELFKKARRMGYGEADVSAVIKAASEFNSGTGESSDPNK